MALALTITSIGRDDLALAVAQSNSLTLSSILLTDAYTDGTASTVVTSSNLGGNVVSTMTASGKKIATGKVQVEGSDNGETTYEAKTLALVYTKEGQTRVFAYYTNNETFIYKVSDTAVMISAAIAIEDSQASSITFSNVTINFPPATGAALGTVRTATQSQVENPPAIDPANPILPSAQIMYRVLRSTLGLNCLTTNRVIDVRKTLTVGMKDAIDGTAFSTSSFSLVSGYYVANFGTTAPDTYAYANDVAYWEMGTTTGKFSYARSNGEDIIYLIKSNGDLFGMIARGTNRYEIKIVSQPTSSLNLYSLPKDSVVSAREVDANIIQADEAHSTKIYAGGSKSLRFVAADFAKIDSSTWRYKKPIEVKLYNGKELNTPTLSIGGIVQSTTSFSSTSRTWTVGTRTYTLAYATQVLTCTGAEPQTGMLSYTEAGTIEAGDEVKARGLELSRCGHYGFAKMFISGTSSTTNGVQASGIEAYNVTVSVATNQLSIRYTGPSLSSSVIIEVSCYGATIGGKNHFIDTPSSSGGISYLISTGGTTISNVPIIIKVY